MRTSVLQRCLGITPILFGCIALFAALATAHDTDTDYFNRITLYSHGRITRFTRMPIRVYISPVLKETPYLKEIRHAMDTWQTVSEDAIRFEETETPQTADIQVGWGHSGFHTDFQDMRLGSAELIRLHEAEQRVTEDGGLSEDAPPFTVEVTLILEGDGTIGELSPEETRTVCLHEFGHALGLWGHSPHPGDVSYATATAQFPTERDINTLRKLYETSPDTPQHDIAINLLKAEIAQKPYADPRKRLRSYYLLGTLFLDKGDTDAAIANFQTCRQLDAKFQPAVEKLIQAYHETGETAQAIALLEQRIAQKVSPADYNTLGIFYYERRETEKAIQAFEKALHLAPYHKAARRNLHQLLRAKGFNALASKDFETATLAFDTALQMEPLDASTYQLIAEGYHQAGHFEKAITFYQKAVDLNPVDTLIQQNFAKCYNNYGVSLRNSEDWDAAIYAYRNALRLMPTLHIARTNLTDAFTRKAVAHTAAGELDAAVAAYLELQKRNPDDLHIRNLLGELYMKKGDYAEALSVFQHVYKAEPTAAHALHNLIAAYHNYARTRIDAEDYPTAIRLLESAIQLVPTDLNLRLSLATAYQGAEDYEQAALHVAYVLSAEPNNPQAQEEQINLRIRRGNAFMREREYAAALAEFEAIPEPARDIEIYNTIGYLHLVEGAVAKAFLGFATVLGRDPINLPAFRNLLSLESQLIRGRRNQTKTDTLVRVRCLLALNLMYRKQPTAAVEKYERAVKANASEELTSVVLETGQQLADQFQKRGDTETRAKILAWIAERRGN